jgi:hypothetical protein
MTLRIDGQIWARPASAVVMNGAFDAPPAPYKTVPPQTAGATLASVQKKTKAAGTAQARADQATRSLGTSSDRSNIEYLAALRRDATDAWADVSRDVKQMYAAAPAVPAKAPFAAQPTVDQKSPFAGFEPSFMPKLVPLPNGVQAAAIAQVKNIDAVTAGLQALPSTDPRYQKIVMQAQADAAALAGKDLLPPTQRQEQGLEQGQAEPMAVVDARNRARTQEAVGLALASDTPLKPIASGAAARSRDAVETEILCGKDVELAAAYRSGGVAKAVSVLAAKVEAVKQDPEKAAALVMQYRALIVETGNQLASTAKAADTDESDALSESQRLYRPVFEAKVANMARIYESLGPAPQDGSAAAKTVVLSAATQGIGSNVRAYDEALARAAMKDGNAQLTVDSVTYLKNCGAPERAEQADKILNRSIDEFDKLKSSASKAQDKLSAIETEAQVYVAKSVPFADEAGIQKALTEFWKEPQRVQARKDADTAVMASLNAASALSDMANASGGSSNASSDASSDTSPGATSGKAQKAQKHLDDFIVNPSIMRGIGSSEAAKAFIAERQFASNAARPALFGPVQLERAIGAIGNDDKQTTARHSWLELMKGVSSGQAISSKAVGDFQGAADAAVRLKDYQGVFAKGDDSFDQAVEGMRRAALAKTETEAVEVLKFWAGEFNIASNLPASDATNAKPVAMLSFSRNTLAALSVVGTAIDVVKLFKHPDVKDLPGTSVDAAQAVNNSQMAIRSLTQATEDQLLKRGRWINGAGAFVSTIDFLYDDSGNGTIRALKGVNAVGGWMVFAGGFGEAGTVLAAAGPAGVALGLLSTAAIYQYSRVSASNQYETPAATMFIHTATGLDVRGGRPIAYQLRNDDSHGINHNEVIYLAVAQHLGIQADGSAQSKQKVVTYLNGLDNSAVAELADVAAKTGYKKVAPGGSTDPDGNGQLYAATSVNDYRQTPQPNARGVPPTPESVKGLALWINRVLT